MGSVLRPVLLAVLTLAAFPAAVAAGPQVALSGELPCSRDELIAALGLRVESPEAVVVHGEGDRVSVRIGERAGELDVEGARGPAAARMIALAAAELALPALPVDEPEPEPVAAATKRRPIVVATVRLGSEPTLRGGLGVGVELGGGRWRAAFDGGIAFGVGGDPSSEQRLTLVGAPLRAGIAGGDTTTLRLTALALPYAVTGGVGDTDVLFGIGVDGRGRVRVGTVDVVFVFGADVMANQVTYRWGSEVVAETPRVSLWSGVGLQWGRR